MNQEQRDTLLTRAMTANPCWSRRVPRQLSDQQLQWLRDNIPAFRDAEIVAARVRAETEASRAAAGGAA